MYKLATSTCMSEATDMYDYASYKTTNPCLSSYKHDTSSPSLWQVKNVACRETQNCKFYVF